ncbi:serine/threonine protein kinase [Pyxidicoccus fallax]|uniref:Serine/threonine protein kinase n=1 Tax=Pyxidicoccus fallax TaxID=394095 RepID=A0A848L3B9_9BACT|nr:serine/threonine protein kinase [Pyxidicoccus fallax]NMO13410.1 serine/threonine protein kinase [Pyxidicoccus fallax]NPC80319.1 serine/threonine protein kinase [Pyxidicoccus fallax]
MLRLNALLLGPIVLLTLSAGCTTTGGVALRPDGTPGPQECPEEAKRVMRALKLRVGDAAWVELDANQIKSKPITLYDGPIESILEQDFGTLETTTRLYGQVWTGGPQVVIRYYEAHPPDTEKLPICAVARLSENQLRKLPGSKPGMAILEFSVSGVAIVDAFR